jgi:hypothetical protein
VLFKVYGDPLGAPRNQRIKIVIIGELDLLVFFATRLRAGNPRAKRHSGFLVAAGLFVVLSAAHAAVTINPIKFDDFQLELRTHHPSLPGRFFLGIADASTLNELPSTSALVAITDKGRVLFQRTYKHSYRTLLPTDFKPVAPGLYGYFLCYLDRWACDSEYHFLDVDFRDVYPRRVPDNDLELDSHDVALHNGNFLFLFHRLDLNAARILPEIQEWTSSGSVVFSWRAQDHISSFPSGADPLHANSLSFSNDGNLMVGFSGTSELIKVAYPDGNILWRLSAKDWTFPNDRHGGFHAQHGAVSLPDGHILLFDNGGGYPSRGVEYSLDVPHRTATLVWSHELQGPNSVRPLLGSVQRLRNGNTLIGWGVTGWGLRETASTVKDYAIWTEVNPRGETVREMRSTRPLASYRVYFQEDTPIAPLEAKVE